MIRLLSFVALFAAFWVQAELPQVSSGKIKRLENFSSEYIPARHVDIWLPPGYSSKKDYSVLYMHDGQMLFDANQTWNKQEWRVDEVASKLIAEGSTRPFIVVGVFNGGEARHSEYFPQKPFASLTEAQQQAEYARQRSENHKLFSDKVYSDNYLKFLVYELKPYIDKHFPVKSDRDNTFIMGSSMGGLISIYALSEYPQTFAGAACLSTHWPGSFNQDSNPIPDAFLSYLEQHLPLPGKHRIYFDYGTETLDAWYPPLQARVDNLMRQKGFTQNDWLTREFAGADHSENAWAKRLHIPLQFLLADKTQTP
jgi:enterochelin esterase-like enzyme